MENSSPRLITSDMKVFNLLIAGRCALPSNFDSNYCYGLGSVAACLVSMNFSGYMSTLRNLKSKVIKYE
jgi:6-phosphofructokinase